MNRTNDIELIFREYGRHLYFAALRITGDEEDANEAVQRSLINFYNKTHCDSQKTVIKNVEKYLLSICIKSSIDIIRERKKRAIFIDKFKEEEENSDTYQESLFDTAEIQLSENELIEKIKQGIKRLEEQYRIIFSLRAVEGYEYKEIAQMTGLKESSVRVYYMRGREKIIKYLKTL